MTAGKKPPLPALAVALHFDGRNAPTVTARGHGAVAENILRVAREHGVPVRDEPELVQLLARVELGRRIPETLYVAVAEVIAFAYLLKARSATSTLHTARKPHPAAPASRARK